MMGFLLAFSLIILMIQLVHGEIIVETESGPIRGKNVGKVDAFLGIPYAEPPVGQLRFAKPVPKKSWSQVYDATSLPPSCVQVAFPGGLFVPGESNMGEDCLYLNVWMPAIKNENELKAVMLFIHGGGFVVGSSSMELYNGAKLAEYGDVVVVTINYRLGPLGFFTGFTEDAPGSQGLYDQVLAIQWTKENAKHFGGDPDNIVLFGESAGAFSISMHQISPLSKNLFKRAILQSGSSINPLYSKKNGMTSLLSNAYANMLGCTKEGNNWLENPSDTINCLRNVPAEKFPQVDKELLNIGAYMPTPRIGNDFLPEDTTGLFRKGQFKDSEVLMGITRDEGTLLFAVSKPDIFGMLGEKVLGEMFNKTTAFYAIKHLLGNNHSDEGENIIIRNYLDDVNDEKGYLGVVSEVIGDIIITCGNIFQAEYQSMRGNPVYFYMFDYREANTGFAEWMGVPHFSEVQYVFGNPMFGSFSEQEKELSRDIMDVWTTFAKIGNPTIPGSIKWPPYNYDDPKFLIIGKKDKVGTRPDHNRCERWRNRYQSTIDDSVIKALKRTDTTCSFTEMIDHAMNLLFQIANSLVLW